MKKKINVTIKIIAHDYSNNDLFIERLLKTDHDKLGETKKQESNIIYWHNFHLR